MTATSSSRWRAHPARWAVPVGFCLFGLYVALRETIASGFRMQRHDLGDTRLVAYFLEHELRWLLRDPNHLSLFDRPYFFPAENVGAYADLLLAALPLYAPLRLVWDLDTAYLAYGFLVCAANFAAMYVLLRRAGGFSQLGSSAGAALFAFANTRMMMAMHWQLFAQYWSALCLLAIWALTRELSPGQRRVAISVAILTVAAQLWAGFYLGWFLVFGLAVATPFALAMGAIRRPVWAAVAAHPWTTAAAALLAALSLAPLARHYLEVARESGMRPFEEVMTMLPPPQTWLNMGHQSVPYGGLTAMFPPLQRIPMDHEQRACLGYLSLLLAFAGFAAGWRRPAVRLAGLSFVSIVVLATHLDGATLWRYVYDYFPGAQAIRAVSRISLLLLIPGAVGIAAALTALQGLRFRTAGTIAAWLLGIASVAEQGHEYGTYDIALNREHIAAIVERVNPRCEAFVVSPVGDGGPYWKHQVDAMWAQLEVGIPTLNGYSGRAPGVWDLADVRINGERDEQSVRQRIASWVAYRRMEDWRVCHVLVGFSTKEFAARFAEGVSTVTTSAGGPVPVRLTATNTGTATWPANGQILLALQWDRDQRVFGPSATPPPREVKPGESVSFDFAVRAPPSPGAHELQFRLLVRGAGWFGELPPPIRVEVFEAPAPSPPVSQP